MEHNKTQIYELTDHTRDETKTLVVQHDTNTKTVDYIVTKTVEQEVFIPDVVSHINEFDELHARTHNKVSLEVTSESEEK